MQSVMVIEKIRLQDEAQHSFCSCVYGRCIGVIVLCPLCAYFCAIARHFLNSVRQVKGNHLLGSTAFNPILNGFLSFRTIAIRATMSRTNTVVNSCARTVRSSSYLFFLSDLLFSAPFKTTSSFISLFIIAALFQFSLLLLLFILLLLFLVFE